MRKSWCFGVPWVVGMPCCAWTSIAICYAVAVFCLSKLRWLVFCLLVLISVCFSFVMAALHSRWVIQAGPSGWLRSLKLFVAAVCSIEIRNNQMLGIKCCTLLARSCIWTFEWFCSHHLCQSSAPDIIPHLIMYIAPEHSHSAFWTWWLMACCMSAFQWCYDWQFINKSTYSFLDPAWSSNW